MDLFLVGFAVILVVGVTETILSVRWNRMYFAFGIPIFIRRVDRTTGLEDIALDELEKRTKPAAGAPFVFRRMLPNRIAFREQAFSGGFLHYTPIMRGVIRHEPGESTVVVQGLINWYILTLIAFFGIALGHDFVELSPMFAGVLGIIYFIQAVRYGRVAKALRTSAS